MRFTQIGPGPHVHDLRFAGFNTSDTPEITDNVNYQPIGTMNVGNLQNQFLGAWQAWIGIEIDWTIAIGGGTMRIRRMTDGFIVQTYTIVNGRQDYLRWNLSLSNDANLRFRVEAKVNLAGDDILVNDAIGFAQVNFTNTNRAV